MIMGYPKRKPNRLVGYDYSTPNAYFITVCTRQRKNLFWANPEAVIQCPEDVKLTRCGLYARNAIAAISMHYPAIAVDHYVIMPNHIHLFLQICSDEKGQHADAPELSTVIQQLKRVVTKQAGFPVWQKDFYDHVIRGDIDYRNTWNYIEGNPMKWAEDDLRDSSMR